MCCRTVEDALIWRKYPGVPLILVKISFLDQEALVELLPLGAEEKPAIIDREPLAQGLLTDVSRDTKAEQFPSTQKGFGERTDRANVFRFLANKDRTTAQAALQFVLQVKGVSAVIHRYQQPPSPGRKSWRSGRCPPHG